MIQLFGIDGTNALHLTPYITDGTITWSTIGDESVQVSLPNTDRVRGLLRSPLGLPITAIKNGVTVWNGRLENIEVEDKSITLTALGDMYRLEDRQDYSDFWSTTETKAFSPTSLEEVIIGTSYDQPVYASIAPSGLAHESFTFDVKNRAYITYRNGASIPNRNGAQIYWEVPKESERSANFLQMQVRCRLPTGWLGAVQIRDGIGTASTSINLALINGNNAIQTVTIFQEGGAGLRSAWRQLYILVRNDTGGTYTNTQPDGHWFLECSNIRIMSTFSDNLSTELTTTTTAGSGVLFTPASMDGIYVGGTVAITTNNQDVLLVRETTSTQFRADARQVHASGSILRIPRLRASTVVQGIVQTALGNVPASIEQTAQDLPNTSFSNISSRKALNSLLNEEYVYDMRGGLFRFYNITTNTEPYYLDQSNLSFVKNPDTLTTHVRMNYTSFAGFERTTPYITVPNTQLLERRRRYDTQANNLTTATGIAGSILARRANNVLRAIPKGGILYNQSNGRVSFPVTNTPIVLRNIIPEMYQLGNTRYYLRQTSYDFTTNRFEYVVEEPEDTFTRLLAGV